MTTRKKVSKPRQVLDIFIKHWRPTIGSLVILSSVFALIFKQITTETLAAIVAAMVAAGYIPKSNDNG
jgi:hypothetical protein